MQKVLFIRGLPGSGKSTMARAIADDGSFVHIEADQYFERSGSYKFDAEKLRDAHAWCLARFHLALDAGRHVVVANTFVNKAQLRSYFEVAYSHGIRPVVWEATGKWRSIHNVPKEKMEIMARVYEKDVSGLYEEFDPLLAHKREQQSDAPVI